MSSLTPEARDILLGIGIPRDEEDTREEVCTNEKIRKGRATD